MNFFNHNKPAVSVNIVFVSQNKTTDSVSFDNFKYANPAITGL